MKLNRFIRNRFIFIADLFLVIACVLGSFVLRLNLGPLFMDHLERAGVMLLVALILKPLVYYSFGLYRRLWVYASVQELKLITVAVTTASILVATIIVLLQALKLFQAFSRGVLVIDWLLSLLAVGGLRFALRVIAESRVINASPVGKKKRRALVIGAGDAGALVVREIQKTSKLLSGQSAALEPICFVDDDPAKQKQEIHGVPVVGTLSDLASVVDKFKIDEVIIAIPSASGRIIRSVTNICQAKGVPFRTMPSLHELIGGKVSVNRLREVEISDLLRRDPVQIDTHLVGLSLRGKRVLVTGAGGSIGRELCRQIAQWGPLELVLLGHGENSIFETTLMLEADYPSLSIQSVISDVRDDDRMNIIFERFRPQVVFHTAAHKHVPLMEVNIEEAVTNNILGTKNVVDTAVHHQVERLVMISTDKAVQPTSVMGATKRIAEMIILEAAHRTGHTWSVVRFGNVLGSRGSIIPLFNRQIQSGGPVTVTHPEMERYFMTIPEAVHLVLQASIMAKGGETFALNMGEQVRILDLAEDLIRLSGLEPYKDIDITFTGIRPGEKLKESLWDEGMDYQLTEHPDILRVAEDELLTRDGLYLVVNELIHLAQQGENEAIIKILCNSIPKATVQVVPPPDITTIV
jgi:FlaA1/EpsC-like NDP-sugar epimerase